MLITKVLHVMSCCCYHKGTYFQANHNVLEPIRLPPSVVVATTKVRIFKQITTQVQRLCYILQLLLLPQRYVFSSKSQQGSFLISKIKGCCCYHKGTYFQANHNSRNQLPARYQLLLLPQRYVFSSKSQQVAPLLYINYCCCCYHKGTYFQANHNCL